MSQHASRMSPGVIMAKAKKKVIKRNKKGYFVKGGCPNPAGRPPVGSTKLDELLKSISRVESKKKKKWLDHIVEKSYTDTALAVAILNRMIPVLKAIEISGSLSAGMSEEMAKSIQKQLKTRFGA